MIHADQTAGVMCARQRLQQPLLLRPHRCQRRRPPCGKTIDEVAETRRCVSRWTALATDGMAVLRAMTAATGRIAPIGATGTTAETTTVAIDLIRATGTSAMRRSDLYFERRFPTQNGRWSRRMNRPRGVAQRVN